MTQIIQIETAAAEKNSTMLTGVEATYKCEIGLADTVDEAVARYCKKNGLVITAQTGDGADNTKYSYMAALVDNELECPNFFGSAEVVIYACTLRQSY